METGFSLFAHTQKVQLTIQRINAATPMAVTQNECEPKREKHSLSDFPLYFWLTLRLDKSTAYQI